MRSPKTNSGILPPDRAGVPKDHTVIQAWRFWCRDCGAPFLLPLRARDATGRVVRYATYAGRCHRHRRPYERPPATPHVRDAQRSAVYVWEALIPHGASSEIDWEGLFEELSARRRRSVWVNGGDRFGYTPLQRTEKQHSIDDLRAFSRVVWKRLYPADEYGPPRVVVTRRRRKSSGADVEEVSLAPSMRTRMTLVHELTHAYLDRVLPHGTYEGHGEEFVSLYAHLLARHFDVNRPGLRLVAGLKKARVRFASRDRLWELLALGRDGG